MIHVGDSTNLGLLQEFEWTQRALSRLRVPALVAIGNHDALSSGKAVYSQLYGPFDFAFVYKSTKFVVLNSNSLEFPGSAPNRAWLDAQLSDLEGANSALLVTHQDPRAPAETPGTNGAAFYDAMLRDHAVSLVVHGHLDDFELDTWLGVPVLQCSTFRRTSLYTVVTVKDGLLSFEVCRFGDCRPRAPVEPPEERF